MEAKKLFKTLIFTFCFCFSLMLGLSFIYVKNQNANAYTSISGVDKVENLYNNETGKFDGNNLDAIAKKAGYKSVKELLTSVSGGTTKVATDFGINTTVDFGTYNYNGEEHNLNWIPTYLSKDSSGNAILTLWLSNTAGRNGTVSDQEIATFTDGTYRYNFTSSDRRTYTGNGITSSVYANTYDSSYIRNVILKGNPTGEHPKAWGYYYNGSSAISVSGSRYLGGNPNAITLTKFTSLTNGALSNYLVAPQNMAWQMEENSMNSPSYAAAGDKAKAYYPTNWVLDKIWLPSFEELKDGGYWKINKNMRLTTGGVGTGLYSVIGTATRTGTANWSSEIVYFDMSGNEVLNAVSYLSVVRPAIHLNLTSAEEDCEYTANEPQSATATYTGNNINISDFDVKNWYKGAYLDSTKIKASVYLNNEEQTTIKDAGDYYVKFEFTDSYKTEISAKNRPLKFLGTPNTSDSQHPEDDTTRWAKFTVKKKPLQVIFTKDSDNYVVASFNTADININDTGERAPVLSVFYDSTDGKGYHFDETTEVSKPNKVGEYRATAKILNPECNYEIDKTKTYYTTYVKDKTPIVKPDISIKSKQYNATEQTFALMGGSGNYKDIKVVVATNAENMVFDSAKGELKATKAGKYTIRIALADSNETKWNDNSTEEYTIEVEITKKVLGISFDIDTSTSKDPTDTNSDKWAWNADKTPTITITGDSYPNDQTRLYIYYYNSTDPSTKYADINNNKVLSEDGKTRTIVMPKLEPGNYVIGVEIRTSEDSNDNYEIARGVAAQLFTVNGTKITLKNPVWKMNGNTITSTTNLKYTYTGSPFVFTVDEDNLRANGVEIDTGKGTNGYGGNQTVTNASNSNYTVQVYLKSLPNYEDYSASFLLTYKIDKAKYNLSNLTWNYSEENNRTFKAGVAQTVTLVGTIPTGLTANYTGNENRIAVNEDATSGYITSVTFTNANSTNYEDPIRSNPSSYIEDSNNPFNWFCEWRIERATLTASWDKNSTSNTDSTTIVLPKLKPDGDISVHLMVDYKYYETDALYENPTLVNVTDIGNDKSKVQYYVIEAKLKSSHSASYKLSPETARCEFSVGSDKNVIQLFVSIYLNQKEAEERGLSGEGLHAIGKTYAYTGSVRQTDVELTLNPTGINKEDIVITYYRKGETTGSTIFPTQVGSYHAEIAVKKELSDSTIVSDDCDEFDFDIVKAKLDLSSVKLKYTHSFINPETKEEETIVAYYNYEQGKWIDTNNKEISNFTYNGSTHSIEVEGLDNIPQEQKDKITISIQNSVNGVISFLNAGNQNIVVNFSYDENNFEHPTFKNTEYDSENKTITLPFNVLKAKVDVSNIVWGYVENGGKEEFRYTKALDYKRTATLGDNGEINGYAGVTYTVKLINVPQELQGCIDYNKDCEHSVIGTYRAQFSLNSSFDNKNFEDVTWPSGLRQQFTWQILPKYIEKPIYNILTAWTEFDNEIKDFTELFTLMEQWSLYYDISITKDGEEYLGLKDNIVNPTLPEGETISAENKFKALYAGKYVVSFTLKIENTTNPNIIWKEFFSPVTIDVKPAEIVIDHWKNMGINAEIATNSPVYDPYFFNYTFKDAQGNEVTSAEINARPGEKFYKVVTIKDEFKSSLTLKGATEHEFEISETGKTIVSIPTVPNNIVYNGTEFDIEKLLINFDAEIMSILLDYENCTKTATNAGTYKIFISFKDPTKYEWRLNEDENSDVTKQASSDVVELTWQIKKASIKGSWQERYNYFVFVPENEEDADKFNLVYLDRYGAIVTPQEFKEEFDYTAQLVLKDSNNYEFVKADNTPFETEDISKTFVFSTKPKESGTDIVKFFKDNLLYLIIGIVILILLILIILLAKRRNNRDYPPRNRYARQYDNFDDYDDRYYRRNRAEDHNRRRGPYPSNYNDDVEVEIMSSNHAREQDERLNNIEHKLDAVLSQNRQNLQNNVGFNPNYNNQNNNFGNNFNNANYNGINNSMPINYANLNANANLMQTNNFGVNGFNGNLNGYNPNNYNNWLPQMDYNQINLDNAENYIKALISAYFSVKQSLNQDIARLQAIQGQMNNIGLNQLLLQQSQVDNEYQNAKQNLLNINPNIKQKLESYDEQIQQKQQELANLTAQRNSLQQNMNNNQNVLFEEVSDSQINKKGFKNQKSKPEFEQQNKTAENYVSNENLQNQNLNEKTNNLQNSNLNIEKETETQQNEKKQKTDKPSSKKKPN